MDQHDPNGTIECSGCEALGRPPGGVTYTRKDQRLCLAFDLPLRWALRDCALHCPTCAAALPELPRQKRRQRVRAPLADSVLSRNIGPMSEDVGWPNDFSRSRAR